MRHPRGETREKLLTVLTGFTHEHGRMPTWKELRQLMGIHRTGLHAHMISLQAEGRLTLLPRGTIAAQIAGNV